jgi:hypothetical protein
MRMRFVKTAYCVFLFSLALALFCCEIPESLKLTDDASNDFVQEGSAPVCKNTKMASGDLIVEREIALAETSIQNLPAIPLSIDTVSLSGPSLLLLLSIQRK